MYKKSSTYNIYYTLCNIPTILYSQISIYPPPIFHLSSTKSLYVTSEFLFVPPEFLYVGPKFLYVTPKFLYIPLQKFFYPPYSKSFTGFIPNFSTVSFRTFLLTYAMLPYTMNVGTCQRHVPTFTICQFTFPYIRNMPTLMSLHLQMWA